MQGGGDGGTAQEVGSIEGNCHGRPAVHMSSTQPNLTANSRLLPGDARVSKPSAVGFKSAVHLEELAAGFKEKNLKERRHSAWHLYGSKLGFSFPTSSSERLL